MLGCDPIEAMARLAMDENEPSPLRFAVLERVGAIYLAPKRKAIEVSSVENQRPCSEATSASAELCAPHAARLLAQ